MSSPDEVPAGHVRIERVLSAAIEDVFAAWTDPAVMAGWLSPTGQAEVAADVRVDGHLHVVMVGGNMRIEHNGRYVAVEPPRLLSFTWRSAYTGDEPSLVTVRLTPEEGDTTRLVLVHERLPVDTADPHAGGWTAILERLAVAVAAHPPTDAVAAERRTDER